MDQANRLLLIPVRYHGAVWLRGRTTRILTPTGRARNAALETKVGIGPANVFVANAFVKNTRRTPIQ